MVFCWKGNIWTKAECNFHQITDNYWHAQTQFVLCVYRNSQKAQESVQHQLLGALHSTFGKAMQSISTQNLSLLVSLPRLFAITMRK